MKRSNLRLVATVAAAMAVLGATGPAGASAVPESRGQSSSTTGESTTTTNPSGTSGQRSADNSSTAPTDAPEMTPSTNAPRPVERPVDQPAKFLDDPVVVIKTDDSELRGTVEGLKKELEGNVTVELRGTDVATAESEATVVLTTGAEGGQSVKPAEIIGMLEALVALKDHGFVRSATPNVDNPTLSVGILPPGNDESVPELSVRGLSVEIPVPELVTTSPPVTTPSTGPGDATAPGVPAETTRTSETTEPAATIDSGVTATTSLSSEPTGSPSTTVTADPTSSSAPSIGVSTATSQPTGAGLTGDDGSSREGTSQPADGVKEFHSGSLDVPETVELDCPESVCQTGELRSLLARVADVDPLEVAIEFDLAPSPDSPGPPAQFKMNSLLTQSQLLGNPEPPAAKDTTEQAGPVDSGADSGNGMLIIMLLALVLVAGGAAFAVWFFAVRQRQDAAGLTDGSPALAQPVPGRPPPSMSPRPSDATEGAALPVAAGTATLTDLSFRSRVAAREQLSSLATVASVDGTAPSVASGSEGLEKWWGGPAATDASILAGWSEKISGKGEDGAPVALATAGVGSTLIAVADGLGGAGARTVSTDTGDATAAKVASRLALEELAAWWAQTHDAGQPDYMDLKRSIAGILRHQLRDQGDAGVVGTLVREYPTTLAAATVVRSGDTSRVRVIWAGDSRVYLLSQKGFQLLTTDQVSGDTDELAQMYADPQMTNMISADRPFNLQVAETTVKNPFLVLAATDGCFGYLPSPAHMEAVLLQDLQTSASEVEWARALTHRFNSVAGDDTSFAALLVGSSFEQLRNALRGRADQLHRQHIAPVAASSGGDERRRIIDEAWRGYRPKFVARRAQMPVMSVEGE